MSDEQRTRRRPALPHSVAFWIVAAVFLLVLSYATVPTPLYPLYAELDDFGPATTTVIFAAFAFGVIVTLYLFGHVSDWVGRRPILITATSISALAAVGFLLWTEVPGLIAARVVDGASVGMLTATATAHLGELRSRARPGEGPEFSSTVAGAVTLGGLGLGALIGGVFAEWLPNPLHLPHLVYLVLLVIAAVVLLFVPETVTKPDPAPRWRPQRIAAPPGARRIFVAAGFSGFGAFAVFGLFTALAPTLLASTFDVHSHLLGGATTFAVFGAAALGQVVLRPLPLRTQLTVAIVSCTVGLAAVAAGAFTADVWVFLAGGITAGLGVGLLFRASIQTVAASSAAQSRAAALALLFLISYCGLAIPALLVGLALLFAPAPIVLVAFAAVAVAITVPAALALRTASRPR